MLVPLRRRALPDLARLQGFSQVGAHCLYAPGTRELPVIKTITDQAGGPVNILVPLSDVNAQQPVPFQLSDLAEIGVRRISLGGSLYKSQVTHAAARVRHLLTNDSF